MNSSPLRMIFISFLILFTLACEEIVWDNPYDNNTALDPSEWAPRNLQAQVLSDSQIKVTWEQDEKLIEGFRIERQKASSSWTQIEEVAADITQYIDIGINTLNSFYDYRVYAYTTNNLSDYSNSAGAGTLILTDVDGNTYQTIKIGNQWWMAENLKVTHYRNRDAIPSRTDGTEWDTLTNGAYCNYNNDTNNADIYGRLYNWYAVNDDHNIAPQGWHIPSDEEWIQLEMYLGMSQSEANSREWRGTNEGGKLKEAGTEHWNSPNSGATNEGGFNALPGGRRASNGYFYSLGEHADFWSSSEYDPSTHAWNRILPYNDSRVWRYGANKQNGVSVRCVRD